MRLDRKICWFWDRWNDDFYPKLMEVRRQAGAPSSLPFRPHISDEYGGGPDEPRVMYIGKHANWSDEKYVRPERVADKNAPFWVFACDLYTEIYRKAGCSAPNGRNYDWFWERLAWSNLMKIGPPTPRGDPAPRLVSRQCGLAKEILLQEISSFEPTAVVLVTGEFCSGLVHDVFGAQGLWYQYPGEREIAWLRRRPLPNDTGQVYWTHHPAGKYLLSGEIRKKVIDAIASDHAAFLGRTP